MPLNTREQIIEVISSQGSANAAQIGQALNLTQSAVRYHLGTLLKSHEIEVCVEGQSSGRPGHPARVFRLAPSRHPDNLAQLTDALLNLLEDNYTPSAVYEALAQWLARGIAPSSTPARRIHETMQYLQTRQYQPSWEARLHGPRIRFNNCPYAALIRSHPGLCQVDTRLLAILTGGECHQLSRIDIDSPQHTFCLFDIVPSTFTPQRQGFRSENSNRP